MYLCASDGLVLCRKFTASVSKVGNECGHDLDPCWICMLELVALAFSLDIAGASNTNLRVAHTSVLRNGVVLVSHVASPGYTSF